MALVALEQCFPKTQGVIDDGLAADRLTAGPYTRGRMVYAERGVIPDIN